MNKKILVSLILVILWMGVIYYLSSMDKDESSGKSLEIVEDVVEKVDKITGASEQTIKKHKSFEFLESANYYFRRSSHAFVYFILSILTINLLMQLHKYKLYICNIISIIFCFIYACTDELHQSFIMGRTGRFFDTFIDTFGAILGCLFISLIYKLYKKRKS